MKQKQGFTLVEILVVATIIMVLAGIGFVSYSSLSRQSRDSRRIADLQNLRSALEFYRSDNDYYPLILETLKTDGYLNSVPKDPKENTDYGYSTTDDGFGNQIDYQLCAFLENDSVTVAGCGTDTYNFIMTPLGEE